MPGAPNPTDPQTHPAQRKSALWVTTVALSSLGLVALLGQCAHQPQPHATSSHPSATSLSPLRAGAMYSRSVVVPADAGPQLTQAARDLVQLLSEATGQSFALEKAAAHGIFLVRSNSASAPRDLVEKLAGRSREAYAIRSHGDGKLTIVANGDDGLVFGAYQYLESLGFRFYLPNDHWTIVPALEGIERDDERIVEPAFRVRQFFGTGGFGKALAVDPKARLPAQWETWKRRNGFGEEFHIGGHSGETFNLHNKQALLAHPEYLASVNGNRVPWSKSAKLDPTNPGALELYVQDRLQAYRAQQRRDPNGPSAFAVSVEPADGGGHCDSPDCDDLGSVSDQQFFIANAVARALRQEFPDAKANLFAYNLHADVPSIAIEPNVYVTLVPYAFRRDGRDPSEFIAEWAKKKSPLSIYDYWSIPDWALDLPSFDYRNTPAQKLKFWRTQHIEGFLAESTYSAGAMGLGWYVAGHLMWDPNRDANALADEFFRDAFAAAAAPMRRMLDRWAAGFLLSSLELHATFSNLREAFQRSGTSAVNARLVDYAGYVQYMRLRHELDQATPADAAEKTRALALHLWRLYDSAMLDTFRLQQLLLPKNSPLRPELEPTNANLDVWRSLKPVTEAEARAWISDGVRDYPDLGVTPRYYAGDLRPASSVTGGAAATASAAVPQQITLVGSTRLELTIPAGREASSISLYVTSPLVVRLLGANSTVISSQQLAKGDALQTFNVVAPAAGTYPLELRVAKNAQTTLVIPAELGVGLDEFRIPKAVQVPELYFYVPPGEPAVVLYDPLALPEGRGPLLLDAARHALALERRDGGHLLIARAASEQRGQIWSLLRATSPSASLRLLNAPQRFALSPGALRVPASALPTPAPAARAN